MSAILILETSTDTASLALAVEGRIVLDRDGTVAGGLNVSMPMGHESSDDAVARVLPVLQETARAMRNLI